MRIFFLTDQQDWKGHSVPRGCPFLHWIWDCLGIGCSSTKISLQHFQRHYRTHQVSSFQSVMVMQHVWRGRVSCVGCLQLRQLWIPTMGQTSGCCTSMRQTDHREAPETDPLKCFSMAYQKLAACPPQHLSLAAEVHQRAPVMTVTDMKEFLPRFEVAFACELSSISV